MLSASQINAIKTRINNLMASRNKGTTESRLDKYATGYDFTTTPAENIVTKEEHGEKTFDLLLHINSNSTAGVEELTYEGDFLPEIQYTNVDSWLTTLEGVSNNPGGTDNSGCRDNSCTGLCQKTCASSSTTGSYWSCPCQGDCTGCTSCDDSCVNGCADCTRTCGTGCGEECVSCVGECKDACYFTCGYGCSGLCFNCDGTCTTSCADGCTGSCQYNCEQSCGSCVGTARNQTYPSDGQSYICSCQGECSGGCSSGCGSGCTGCSISCQGTSISTVDSNYNWVK